MSMRATDSRARLSLTRHHTRCELPLSFDLKSQNKAEQLKKRFMTEIGRCLKNAAIELNRAISASCVCWTQGASRSALPFRPAAISRCFLAAACRFRGACELFLVAASPSHCRCCHRHSSGCSVISTSILPPLLLAIAVATLLTVRYPSCAAAAVSLDLSSAARCVPSRFVMPRATKPRARAAPWDEAEGARRARPIWML